MRKNEFINKWTDILKEVPEEILNQENFAEDFVEYYIEHKEKLDIGEVTNG